MLESTSSHDWALRGLLRCARFSRPLCRLSSFLHFTLPVGIIGIALLVQSVINSSWPIYVGFAVLSAVLLRQPHRTCDAMEQVNPTLMGVFLSGSLSGTAYYCVHILPAMQPFWPYYIFPYFLYPLWVLLLLWIVCTDPGEIEKRPGAFREEFGLRIDTSAVRFCKEVLAMTESDSLPEVPRYVDQYCVPCDRLWRTGLFVKHCKLCKRCFVEFDHHCLFLSTCVACRNVRAFIVLISLTCVMMWWFVLQTPLAVLILFHAEAESLAKHPITYRIYRLGLCAAVNRPFLVSLFLGFLVAGVWCISFIQGQLGRFLFRSAVPIHRDGWIRTIFNFRQDRTMF